MKWLIRYLFFALTISSVWLILGIIQFVESGDTVFLQVGGTVFMLVNAVMAIYFIRLYSEESSIKSR